MRKAKWKRCKCGKGVWTVYAGKYVCNECSKRRNKRNKRSAE